MKRLALVAIVLATLLAMPVGGAAAVGSDHAGAVDAPTLQVDGNATATPTANNSSSGPTIASQVRLTPITFEDEFLSVSVREADSAYGTTGPFAVFTASHRVDAARIAQGPATATVLEGGNQIKIAYSDDAAPTDEASLYTLELYFEDGSTKTVDLHATKTDVSVGAAELSQYEDVIDELQVLAEEHGYGTGPDALLEYLTWVNDRADLIDGFLTESALQLFALLVAASSNWLFWLVLLGLIALVATWLSSRYGDMLESLQNDVGRSERKRRELELAYEEQKQTADEHTLDEVSAVGSNAIYWDDAYGTRSPAQLAQMAANGAHVRGESGLQRVHDGVEDLDVDNLEDSWLEPVIRENRIPTAKQALGELKATLEWMETKHNLGHLFRDARDDLEQMIDEIERQNQSYQPGEGVTAADGGDD